MGARSRWLMLPVSVKKNLYMSSHSHIIDVTAVDELDSFIKMDEGTDQN